MFCVLVSVVLIGRLTRSVRSIELFRSFKAPGQASTLLSGVMGAVVVLWCNYDNKNKTREGLAPLQTKLDVVQTKLGVVEGGLRELKTGLHSTQVLLFHVAQAMVGNRNELRA